MTFDRDLVDVHLRAGDGVSTIVLDRKGRINAYSASMYREIRQLVRVADEDPDTSVIVFSAVGEVFGAGGDLHEMLQFLDEGEPGGPTYAYRDDLPFRAVRACHKPTLAVVRGTCVGGGFGLATACDIVIVADGTRMGIPEAKVGLIDGLAIAALYGHVPLPSLKYLLFTGALIDAQEALRLGLVLECVAPDRLDARAREIAQELRSSSSQAIATYKRIFRSYERPDHVDDVMDLLQRDPDTAARIRAFFDKNN